MDIKLQLRHLIALQKAETEIKRLQDLLASVEEDEKALETRLSKSKDGLDTASETLKTLKTTCRELEREVQDETDQIAKRKARLSQLKSNKEYQATLREITDLEKRISQKEDRILEIYENLEKAESQQAEAEKELRIQTRLVSEEKDRVKKAAEKNQAELARKEEERRKAINKMDPRLISRFENLRAYSGAMFIAPVKDAVCHGCNMNIPPQLYNELQRMDQLVQCPHCERIIYWQEGEPV